MIKDFSAQTTTIFLTRKQFLQKNMSKPYYENINNPMVAAC
jgi:hypothetical protein